MPDKKGRGAPVGNQNATKSRLFSDKLRKILTQQPERLEKIAEELIHQAEDGEAWAIKELIDRLEGKPHQAVALEDREGMPLLSGIQVTFVKPNE
jgi:Mn-dependent DtxR family transcriptional regulator